MVWKLAVALGVILLALGVTGVVLESGRQGLEYQVLASPAGGMTAVYVGAGGPDATQVLPGATRALPIDGVPGAPVGPTEFLEPAKLTFISHGQSEPAYWKVWWDGAAQESAAVSLQQNYDAADAEASFADLQQTFDRPALVGKGDYGFTTEAGFSVPGVPGASAGVLDGSFDFAGASTAVQFRYLLVARGSVVALVGMTAFGRPTNRSTFDSFAAHEYSALDGPASHLLLLWLAVAAGAVLVVVGLFERSRRRPAAPATSVRPVPPAAGPMPYEPSGYGAAPPGYGAPPGYVVPPPSYGVSSPGFGPAGAGGYSPSGPPPYKPPPGRGTASPASGSAPAAGWYRDPSPEAPAGQFRYWDGTTWTYSTKDSLDDG